MVGFLWMNVGFGTVMVCCSFWAFNTLDWRVHFMLSKWNTSLPHTLRVNPFTVTPIFPLLVRYPQFLGPQEMNSQCGRAFYPQRLTHQSPLLGNCPGESRVVQATIYTPPSRSQNTGRSSSRYPNDGTTSIIPNTW